MAIGNHGVVCHKFQRDEIPQEPSLIMNDIESTVKRIISILLLLLFLVANIYTIRQISRYGMQLFFYTKMSVANQVGGTSGLKEELNKIITQDKPGRELTLAKAFQDKLSNLINPGKFLEDTTGKLTKDINLMRILRNISFGLIFLILLLRLAINIYDKKKNRQV